MLVNAIYISKEEFNKKLKEFNGRIIYLLKKPEVIGMNVYVYTDGQSNVHLIYKDFVGSLKEKQVHHYAFDPYDPDRRGTDVIRGEGHKAFKKAMQYCQKYGESLDYESNKDFVLYNNEELNVVAFMYHYVNRSLPSRQWYKHCYGYDMNSCYPFFMTKELPYGNIVGQHRIVEEDELGFNHDLTFKGDESFILILPGNKADIIFKKKIYKGLQDFVNYEYKYKQTANEEERQQHKLILNSLIGILKYHNVFMRIAILEYARMYIQSLKDENTIMQTVDSIVSLVPRPDLDIGNNLGQFKEEHTDESFIWINDSQKKWANSETTKKGLKGSKKLGNFQLIKPPYRFDTEQLKIIRQQEEWSRLWPEEN